MSANGSPGTKVDSRLVITRNGGVEVGCHEVVSQCRKLRGSGEGLASAIPGTVHNVDRKCEQRRVRTPIVRPMGRGGAQDCDSSVVPRSSASLQLAMATEDRVRALAGVSVVGHGRLEAE